MSLRNKTVAELQSIIKEIRTNPMHTYSGDEVTEALAIDAEFHAIAGKFSQKLAGINRINKIIIDGFTAAFEAANQKWMPILENVQDISKSGWYISPNVIADMRLIDLGRLSRPENLEEFEEAILLRADTLIPQTIAKCVSHFPKRKPIFDEIFIAFQHGLYNSVVTLAYSQTDGLCNDEWGFGFFDKEKGKDKSFKMKAHGKLKEHDLGVISIFVNQLGIAKNEATMYAKEIPSELAHKTFNRHYVIHGHSVNFGTKTNAVRAILLLDFISYMILEIKRS